MRRSASGLPATRPPRFGHRRPADALYDIYFDTEWYLLSNDDVARTHADAPHMALRHYLERGWQEGRNPNRFFDTAWYLKQQDAPLQTGDEPLAHYVRTGWKTRRSPHPHFDVHWYLTEYPDVRAAGVEPLRHYFEYGRSEGRQPHPKAYLHATFMRSQALLLRDSPGPSTAETTSAWFALSTTPLVSVIIVNRSGAAHLPDVLDSVAAQTYRNLEVIAVVDGSTDDLRSLAASYPFVKLAANPETLGFAEANNIGFSAATGELIAVLDCDARADPNWLERMVHRIRQSTRIAAVAPRIRFWSPFHRLTVSGVEAFQFSRERFVASLAHPMYFIREGADDGCTLKSAPHVGGHRLVLDIPIQPGPYIFEATTGEDTRLAFGVDGVTTSWHFGANAIACGFLLPESVRTTGFHIIDNAGTVEAGALDPHDHGFGAVDDGSFDQEREVEYLCGGAALIRRDALHGEALFVGDFQAGHEDGELSKRLTSRGYTIVYEPHAIVYRRHSAPMSGRSSPCRQARQDEIPRKARLRIGVYNRFWNTLGGGEAHALDIATVLASHGHVDLISTEDFNIQNLLQYFAVPASKFSRRLVSTMRPEVTAEYDVFVNCSHLSDTPSRAPVSYFVVSFPDRAPSPDFLKSYDFLANSGYTLSWMQKYWGDGNFKGQVLYPAIPPVMHLDDFTGIRKERVVLSVGRFCLDGHAKNQLLIAEAFAEVIRRSEHRFDGWSLVLIGSATDPHYLDAVRKSLQGIGATIITDAMFEQVRNHYRAAAIYVHASGHGKDASTSPEQFEHFGMAVAQALGSGCQTLVFGAGGPKEIVETAGGGLTFLTRDDLVRELERLMRSHDAGQSPPMTAEAIGKVAVFSKAAQVEALTRILERDLAGLPQR